MPLIDLEITDQRARLTLNRPDKRNALTRAFLEEICEAVQDVAGDESVRLLTVAAAGPVFCAGMDLEEMQERTTAEDPAEEWRWDTQVYRDLLVELTTIEIPTIAAVQGPVLAGGLGIVLACDLVVAADHATFSLPEPKRGITAAVVTPLLHYRAGTAAASWLLLSGEAIDASRARQAGLCHEAVSKDRLDDRLRELEASILTGSRAALSVTKQQLQAVAGPTLIEQIDAAREASARARKTADAREGLQAFLDKRNPAWYPKDTE